MVKEVYLKDIWPSLAKIREAMSKRAQAGGFPQALHRFLRSQANPKWNEIPSSVGEVYAWDKDSTYIQEPPFFTDFSMQPGEITENKAARPLGIFGDSVTTDHISPAGAIKKRSPAGKYLLLDNGVSLRGFSTATAHGAAMTA